MITNPDARRNYEILEEFQAGIVLKGFEVKAIRAGRGNLKGSYVVFQGNELYLINFSLHPYQEKNTPGNYKIDRPRKLLLKKSEIRFLLGKAKEKGLTLIPLSIIYKGDLVKVIFALSKGLRKYEKREKIRKKEFEREKERVEKNS